MEYTTSTGYTYKSIKEEDITKHKDILEAATKYKSFKSIKVSYQLWRHLSDKYKIEKLPYSEYRFIFKDHEGSIGVITGEDNSPLVTLVFDTRVQITNAFLKRLTKYNKHNIRKGLQAILDPNIGGKLNTATIDYVRLIHFG